MAERMPNAASHANFPAGPVNTGSGTTRTCSRLLYDPGVIGMILFADLDLTATRLCGSEGEASGGDRDSIALGT
jgi:hypothetical protein